MVGDDNYELSVLAHCTWSKLAKSAKLEPNASKLEVDDWLLEFCEANGSLGAEELLQGSTCLNLSFGSWTWGGGAGRGGGALFLGGAGRGGGALLFFGGNSGVGLSELGIASRLFPESEKEKLLNGSDFWK